MSKFVKGIVNNYFSVAGAQLFSIPLSLLYLSLVTRTIGPVNYGKFALILASSNFFCTIFVNWVRSATIRFGTEEFTKHNKLNKIFYVQVLILFAVVLFACSLVFIFRNNISHFTGFTGNVYQYVILYLISFAFFDFICQLLQATHQMRGYGLGLILRQCVLIGMAVFFIIFKFGLSPVLLIIIEAISYLAVGILAIFTLSKKSYFTPATLSKDTFFSILKYSWPMIIIFGLGYFSLWADTLLIRLFMNFNSVGMYQAASRFTQYVSNLIMPVSIVAFPMVVSIKSNGRDDLIHKYAQRIIPQASFFWGIFIILLMLCAGLIFKVVYGSQFMGSVLIFRVLLIGLSFQFLSIMHGGMLQSYDFNRTLLYIALITVLLNLSGDLLLIPRMGIIGAAFSKAFSFIVCGLLYMHKTITRLGIGGNNYKNSIFILAIPALLLISFLFTDNFSVTFICALICIIILYVFVKQIRLFTNDDADKIKQLNMPQYLKSFIGRIYDVLS